MSNATITISLDEYDQLQNDSVLLNALRNQGVDNWNGWEFALEEYWSVVGEDND